MNAVLRWCASVVVISLCLGASGCGGGGDGGPPLPRKVYRHRLNLACKTDARGMARVPLLGHRKSLTVAELQQRADAAQHRFLTSVGKLNAPTDLHDVHQHLVKLLGPASPVTVQDQRALTTRLHDFVTTYRGLGATGCVHLSQRALRRIRDGR